MPAIALATIPGGFPWLSDVRSLLAHLPVRIIADGTDLIVVPTDAAIVTTVLRAQVAAALGAR